MAKPNQNHASRSFWTKISVGSKRPLLAATFVWPSLAMTVSRSSVGRASIGGSFHIRPERWRRIEFEGFAVIADGRWQLACRWRKLYLRRPRLPHQNGDAADDHSDYRDDHEDFQFHGLPVGNNGGCALS